MMITNDLVNKKPIVMLVSSAKVIDGFVELSDECGWIIGKSFSDYIKRIREKFMAILTDVDAVIDSDTIFLSNSCNSVVIFDPELIIPCDARVLKTVKVRSVIIVCMRTASEKKKLYLKKLGVVLIFTLNLTELTSTLFQMGIESILIEGSRKIKYSAMNEGIVDKLLIFNSPEKIEYGRETLQNKYLTEIKFKDMICLKDGRDVCIEGNIAK